MTEPVKTTETTVLFHHAEAKRIGTRKGRYDLAPDPARPSVMARTKSLLNIGVPA